MYRLLTIALIHLVVVSGVDLRAEKYNPALDIGDETPKWKNLPGTDGKMHSLQDLKNKDVIVVVFTCNSCPYAVDYEDRINAFAQHCTEESKVALVAINVNKVEEDLMPAMKDRADKKKFNFPYLFDESQQIGKDFGATRTPEFFVLNKERKVVYMGAMDDSTDVRKVSKKYVQDAVQATLAGNKPEITETPTISCIVRYERNLRKRHRARVK